MICIVEGVENAEAGPSPLVYTVESRNRFPIAALCVDKLGLGP